MIIDTNRIEQAIFNDSAKVAAEICKLPVQTIRQYRSNPKSSSYRDWEKISLKKSMEIIQNLDLIEDRKKDLSEC